MIHIQHSTSTKLTISKPTGTKLSTKQIIPLPQQAVFGCAGMLPQAGISGENLLGRGSAFVSLWSDCEQGLFVDSLSIDSSADSSAYINRLEPTRYRSGERTRLAVMPS